MDRQFQREEIHQGRFLFYLDLSNSKVNIFTPTDDLPTISELEAFFECSLSDSKIFDDATSRLPPLNIAYGTCVVAFEFVPLEESCSAHSEGDLVTALTGSKT
jgi:hypothetical protein